MTASKNRFWNLDEIWILSLLLQTVSKSRPWSNVDYPFLPSNVLSSILLLPSIIYCRYSVKTILDKRYLFDFANFTFVKSIILLLFLQTLWRKDIQTLVSSISVRSSIVVYAFHPKNTCLLNGLRYPGSVFSDL